MESSNINVLITTFNGLQLPPTLSLVVSRSTSVTDFQRILLSRLPPTDARLLLSTLSSTYLPSTSPSPLTNYLPHTHDDSLSLRLSLPLCGGKGGFGSQLRAAGGRMSSRKKRKIGDENGSSRNLDGRRVRTAKEAKALAEYLAIKPEMERKEKEKRKQRWRQVLEMVEKKRDDIRSGRHVRLDGKWVEEKEDAEERTREAVAMAMKKGGYSDNILAAARSSSNEVNETSESDEADVAAKSQAQSSAAASPVKALAKPRTFAGFDEDEEFMSSEEEK